MLFMLRSVFNVLISFFPFRKPSIDLAGWFVCYVLLTAKKVSSSHQNHQNLDLEALASVQSLEPGCSVGLVAGLVVAVAENLDRFAYY